MKKVVGVRTFLDKDIHREVKLLAVSRCMTMEQILTAAVEYYLDEHRKELQEIAEEISKHVNMTHNSEEDES